MLDVCKHLHIKTNKVIDESNNSVEIAGSIEVKGIKGTDKRNYIVDLQGFTPRDSNYKGEEYFTCLYRPELIMGYQKSKNLDFAIDKLQAFVKVEEESYKKKMEEIEAIKADDEESKKSKEE